MSGANFSPENIRDDDESRVHRAKTRNNFNYIALALHAIQDYFASALQEIRDSIIKPALRGGFAVNDVRYYGNIYNAVNQIPATMAATVFITNAQTINTNLTIPSNISIEALNGGSFATSSGATLTIRGPFAAGLFRVFTGSGAVTFADGSLSHAYPEWWGAVADGATNSTAALLAATIAVGRVRLLFQRGAYCCVNLDLSSYPCVWEGVSGGGTTIQLYSDTADMITLAPSSESISWEFSNIQFASFFQYKFTANPGFVPSDVGKQLLGATSGATGRLVFYNNGNRYCYVSGGAVYTIGETASVVSGTGSGVITENMATTRRAFNCTRVALSKWSDCWFGGFYSGIDFFLNCNTSYVNNCTFGSFNQFGLRLSSSGTSTDIRVSNCFFDENLNSAVYCNSSWNTFIGNQFVANSFRHVLLDAAAENNIFVGNFFQSAGPPETVIAFDIYGSNNIIQANKIDPHTGPKDIIVRSGATNNAFLMNTARNGYIDDSGTSTVIFAYAGNRFQAGFATGDGVSGFQMRGPAKMDRPINTQGLDAGLILCDQILQPKVVLSMEGLGTNDLQLMTATAMRFYANSDLVSTGEVGRWLANGDFQVNNGKAILATANTPASASATGTAGTVCWDANFIYVCTAANTWKRVAIATW